jgi:NADH-quinone oxidoreductase subunit F
MPVEQTQLLYRHRNVPGINRLETYVAHGGYEQFRKAVSMDPEAIIEEVKVSGLRGRGGA